MENCLFLVLPGGYVKKNIIPYSDDDPFTHHSSSELWLGLLYKLSALLGEHSGGCSPPNMFDTWRGKK